MLIVWNILRIYYIWDNPKGFFLLGNAFFLEATHRVYAFLNCFSHLLNLTVKNKRKNTKLVWLLFCPVQFSHLVVSNSLRPHGLQHPRLPCPSPTPGTCSNSCISSQWCHPTISSSVIPFSSCLQSYPTSGSFAMGWLFASGDQNTGVSASASVLPMNNQDWFPLG